MSATAFHVNVPMPGSPLDLSAASSNSGAFKLELEQLYSIQAVITGDGTASGNAYLMASDDPVSNGGPIPPTPTNFTKIAGSDAPVTGNGNIVWNVQGVAYDWVKVHYDKTSGTGSMALEIVAKGV